MIEREERYFGYGETLRYDELKELCVYSIAMTMCTVVHRISRRLK